MVSSVRAAQQRQRQKAGQTHTQKMYSTCRYILTYLPSLQDSICRVGKPHRTSQLKRAKKVAIHRIVVSIFGNIKNGGRATTKIERGLRGLVSLNRFPLRLQRGPDLQGQPLQVFLSGSTVRLLCEKGSAQRKLINCKLSKLRKEKKLWEVRFWLRLIFT